MQFSSSQLERASLIRHSLMTLLTFRANDDSSISFSSLEERERMLRRPLPSVIESIPTLAPSTTWSRSDFWNRTEALVHNKSNHFVDVPSHRLNLVLPIAWVHVPKCGSSFANFLIDLPGLCPGIPRSLIVMPPTSAFTEQYDLDKNCPGAFVQSTWQHRALGGNHKLYEGHGFITLRQPEQRIISAYRHGQQGWQWHEYPAANLLQYAQVMQGCVVRMLTRDRRACYVPQLRLGSYDVAVAQHRLRVAFSFVGLVEQWDLSICLGHKMFGGICRDTDFLNTRPGRQVMDPDTKYYSQAAYNTSELHGFRDAYDGAVYKEAKRIFAQSLLRYDVSLSTCADCFLQAGFALVHHGPE